MSWRLVKICARAANCRHGILCQLHAKFLTFQASLERGAASSRLKDLPGPMTGGLSLYSRLNFFVTAVMHCC